MTSGTKSKSTGSIIWGSLSTICFLKNKFIISYIGSVGGWKRTDIFLKSLNDVSARLDTADRDDANSNHSEFRSLKIDESYNLNIS